jgi:putative flippase GtrA
MSAMILSKQMFSFLVTGCLATALHFAVLGIGVNIFMWPVAVASGVGYFAGSILSYSMNYFFTFESNKKHSKAIGRFYIMVSVGWLINFIIMLALVDWAGYNKWVCQVVATCSALTWNYLISRNWVFKSA